MNWEAIWQFVIENIGFLYENFSLYSTILIVVVMGVIIGICSLLKKPIKAITKHIKNETLRKLCNKIIIVMAFGVSIGIYYLLAWLLPQYVTIDWVQITLSGSLAIVGYALGDGVITKAKATDAVNNVKEVIKDGKIDKNDNSAIKEFYEKVK